MTAFADITPNETQAQDFDAGVGHAWMAHLLRRFLGASLVLVALGFWFAPGGTWHADTALMKLGLSMFAAFAGLAVLSGDHDVAPVTVEVDTVRRELRMVRGTGRNRQVLRSTPVRDLGRADVDGMMVRIRNADGDLLAEVAMSDGAVRTGLMSILRDEGKL